MQRHSKILQTKVNAKAVVTALICVVFLLIGSVVSAYAITPPVNADGQKIYQGGKPTLTDAEHIVNIIDCMQKLHYFQFGDFIVVGKTQSSSSTRIYYGIGSYEITDGVFTATPSQGGVIASAYFTTQGFESYSSNFSAQTLNIEDVVCYLNSGSITLNPLYVPGSLSSPDIITLSAQWTNFYNKVWNYDTNLQNATNAGFAQGQLVGRVEGREEGYETGYDEGYDDGYVDGYDVGANAGYQNGLTQGREEGYETGYDEGEQYGYEVGYREGQDYTYPIAYQEGYDDGYEQGASIGGAPSVSYELDVGSIISALPQAARNIIDGALGFEIFGINVAGTLTAILVVAIVGFVVKWLLSLKS